MEDDTTHLLAEISTFLNDNPAAATLVDAALNPPGQARPTGLLMYSLDAAGAATVCYLFKFYFLPWLAVGRALTTRAAARAIQDIERSKEVDPAVLERAVESSRRLEKLLEPLKDPSAQAAWNQLEERVAKLGLPAAEDHPPSD